jgi:hypothetical protein
MCNCAVDHDVALGKQRLELLHRAIDDGRGQHDPDHARRRKPSDQIGERGRGERALLGDGAYGIGVNVVRDTAVAAFISRRDRLAPMRPKPIMPSCIRVSLPLWPLLRAQVPTAS